MSQQQNRDSSSVILDGSLCAERKDSLRSQLSQGLQQARAQGHKELIVSWQDAGDIDGIGLALLLATQIEFAAEGGQICLRGFSEKHQELLRITRTDSVLKSCDEAA